MSDIGFSPALPEHVAFVALGPEAEPDPLYPEEEALLHPRAVEARYRNFRLGRTAARRALATLGIAPTPILRGPDREPLWPDDIVGSITHAGGYAMAAVARRADCGGIGVDLEHRDRYFAGLEKYVAFDDELYWLAGLSGEHHSKAVLEVFSVKESVYKAFFPRVQRFFGFEAARVAPPSAAGTREAWLVHALDETYPPGRRFAVGAVWQREMVLTSIVLDAEHR